MSKIEGLACASSSVCRNIIVEDEQAKKKFVEYDGPAGFVKLVELPPNVSSMSQDDQMRTLDLRLEALLTICDFLEDSDDDKNINPNYAKLVVKLGLRDKIKKLFGLGDKELEDIATDVLASLDSVGA